MNAASTFIHGFEPGSASAIVLGLALRNSLGDLFSGIAIGIDRPFKIGYPIVIEGALEGRVVETNWRSTRIATADNDIATAPISSIAFARSSTRAKRPLGAA